MATPKKVSFSPQLPTDQAPRPSPNGAPPVNPEDELLEKPTILRIKRRRDELASDVVVLEAQLPSRKKKTMQELTDALQGMKVAQDLHQQFKDHLVQTQTTEGDKTAISAATATSKATGPPATWSAPSKTIENQMRKVFRLLGSDDSKSEEGRRVATLVNDAQSGRVRKRDLILAVNGKTYESERKKRMAEAQRIISEKRSFHLRRVEQVVARLPGEYADPEDEMVRMLELFSNEKETVPDASKAVTPQKKSAPGALQLPVVHSAKKLKEQQLQKEADEAKEASEFVTFFYVLDDDAPLAELGEFDAVQVPVSQFRQELLDEFVLEGEYSEDEDISADSSDSQNRSDDWDYGSDREEDADGNMLNSSDDTDEEEGEVDEMMDDQGDYYHRSYTQRGYDLEIDPHEGAGSSDED